MAAIEGLTETITLPSIACTLALADVYDEGVFADEELAAGESAARRWRQRSRMIQL